MKHRLARLSLVLLLAGSASVALADDPAPASPPAAGTKLPVKTADDLPRHTYKIEGKASDFLISDKPFKDFVAQIKTNAEADLAKYDIQDRTTLQGYYGLLQQIAMFQGNYPETLKLVEKVRELEGKESKKLMTGQVLRAYIAAKQAKDFDATFKSTLKTSVSALPWDKVAEDVKSARGRAQMISRDLILGQVSGMLDPVVEQQKGEVSGDLVNSMVAMRVTLDHMLAIQPLVAEVYGGIIESNATERKDLWTPTLVQFDAAEKFQPVVVGIWDSGVDTTIFEKSGQIWTNPKEMANGKDDDGNGFIDDIHGIAYDLEGKPTKDLLHPLTELKHDKALLQAHMKGVGDVGSGVDSPEASAFRTYIKSLKKDEVTPFLEDLNGFGGYSHGTHVAGIASEGNPFARILVARITFDHHEIPVFAPSEELSARAAKDAADTINYFKAAHVRVVNMSWGGSRKDIEDSLEKKGVGKTSEERAEISRKLFKIERDGLEAAMKSAPDILFICAAGNSDNDNEFSELIPSGLKLSNMVTIGAVDSAGKPTSFTTFGKSVKLYANGFEVNSYVPGGQKMKFNGTSMASPNAANLAAKLFTVNPKLTVAETISLIEKGATPMAGYDGRFIINPKATIELARKAH